MTPPLLSRIADQMLASIDRDPEAPHYGEESFQRKIDNSHDRLHWLPLPRGGKEANFLLRGEWREVVRAARLTPRQLDVLIMRLDGHTFDDIGLLGRHTKQGAQSIYFQAAKKIVKAWIDYPYCGLSKVYKDEVLRGTNTYPRRPRKNT